MHQMVVLRTGDMEEFGRLIEQLRIISLRTLKKRRPRASIHDAGRSR